MIAIYCPNISLRVPLLLGTTVRSIGRIEFDVDLSGFCRPSTHLSDFGQFPVQNLLLRTRGLQRCDKNYVIFCCFNYVTRQQGRSA